MSEIKDGGPAFPRIEKIQTPNSINWERPEFSAVKSTDGMTLRDYFAAKALAIVYMDADDDEHSAQRAYELADAMLRAREVNHG